MDLTAHLDIPPDGHALAAAREAVRAVLSAWGFRDGAWIDDAVLVADELVANAVRHGGGCLALHVQANGDQVTISAVDGSAVVPRHRVAGSDGGRGLAIIEALSQAWGVADHDGGKRVWVRLLPPTEPSSGFKVQGATAS